MCISAAKIHISAAKMFILAAEMKENRMKELLEVRSKFTRKLLDVFKVI